ncbi:hypothetical protein [uncultured Pseudokineococcus sp.]|uniref:hypothetical protein n=1 Tax=uncultured Pseudokineococcus sp. TaxID=1642928 RepID=UPI0026199CC8|nr:hypothetical protein [uncultured Pseudokineococcus sp.]
MGATTVIRALRAGAAVAVAGGVALGLAPLPLGDLGCPPALGASPAADGQELDVVLACAEQRADRQHLVGGLVVLGLATAAGARLATRTPRLRPPVDAP